MDDEEREEIDDASVIPGDESSPLGRAYYYGTFMQALMPHVSIRSDLSRLCVMCYVLCAMRKGYMWAKQEG